MTGIRVVVGMGKMDRGTDVSPVELPKAGTGTKSPSDLIKEGKLTNRAGAGVTMSLDRSREMEYAYDYGIRNRTVVSPGMYEIGFSMEGYVTVENLRWLQYLYHNKEIDITSTTKIYDEECIQVNINTTNKEVYLINDRGRLIKPGIPTEDYRKYQTFLETAGRKIKFVYTDFANSPEESMFDIAYVVSNKRGFAGKNNEIGVLCGCMIESATISYEAGSDYGIKFTLSGFALREYVETAEEEFYYLDYIDEIPSDILAVGCLSVSQQPGEEFSRIALTDSATFTVTNQLDKIPETCEITYGGAAIGGIEYELDLNTYSNDPQRYLAPMYGYDKFTAGETNTPQRYPRKVNAFKVRSSDQGRDGDTYTKFMDIITYENVVSGLNREFDIDAKIMDNPTIVPLKSVIVYGYEESSQPRPPCMAAGTSGTSTTTTASTPAPTPPEDGPEGGEPLKTTTTTNKK